MADDKSEVGARDRAEVAAGETYEVAHFARAHGITQGEARALIERVGNSREKLEAALAESKTANAPSSRGNGAARSTAGKRKASSRGANSSAKPATRKPSAGSTGAAISRGIAAKVRQAARQAETAARSTATAARNRVSAVGDSIGRTTRSTGKAVSARGADLAKGSRSIVTSRGAKIAGIAAAGVAVGLVVNLGRKAMVQAPTALAGDWLEGLKAEHRATLAVFDLLESSSPSARGKRTALLSDLKAALTKHAFTEENVIYPALRQHGYEEAADRFTHDHGYVKQYLFELGAMSKDSPGFLPKLAAFRADLEKHIREEEDAVLPPLHAALDGEGNARITALANKEGFRLA